MIPYNKPYMTGDELKHIQKAHRLGKLAGDGEFTQFCHQWLQTRIGCGRALLTHSCTAALEMCALLLQIQPGDEIIMPSYTFVSTANAFVLRGGVPVFVDIRADTLNIDETQLEAALTPQTKAIVVVHYAGVACEMDAIMHIAARHKVAVVEDAAQAILSTYNGKPLGGFGSLATLSFHETKNLIAGEGGALLINDSRLVEHAEMVREKGTDRSRFFRGQVDKYTWRVLGSSFLPGELIAAFLRAQLEHADDITHQRCAIWQRYHTLLAPLAHQQLLTQPQIPAHCGHNAHIYYVILHKTINRTAVLAHMRENQCHAVFHYIPLHTSPAGQQFGRTHGRLNNTERLAAQLIRLPIWLGISAEQQGEVVRQLSRAIEAVVGDQ